MKKFYKTVTVDEQGGRVLLDGRPIKTPAGNPLIFASLPLAQGIADEWAAQGEKILPETMPLTRMSATQIDRVAPRRSEMEIELVAYAGSDLLCYRAGEPAALVERQAATWDPLLHWASGKLGLSLVPTSGIMPIDQSEEAMAAAARYVVGLSDVELTAFALAVPPAGSFVIGAAMIAGKLTAEEAFSVSQLDETFQIELWGEDYEAADRRAALKLEFIEIERFLKLARV
ncbi:ATP12 family chaperone protein [Lacibacterium aquatile]|uniref:ATP12 family chaperone protein n=1 Tax=Lacibacterium aquatile TaxID=1168082 RepID=A0ABW5DUR9_9PROT